MLLGKRPPGSHSKIHIVRDGLRILGTILALVRDYKPLTFFGGLGMAMILAGVAALWVIGSVPRGVDGTLLLAWIVAFLALGGLLLTAVGLVLLTIDRRFQEMEHLMRVGRDSVRGK